MRSKSQWREKYIFDISCVTNESNRKKKIDSQNNVHLSALENDFSAFSRFNQNWLRRLLTSRYTLFYKSITINWLTLNDNLAHIQRRQPQAQTLRHPLQNCIQPTGN